MDVERTVRNCIDDDDSTMHSTQGHPSVQVHHDHDISSNLYNMKKNKVHELLNDFDSDEDDEGDNKTYQHRV